MVPYERDWYTRLIIQDIKKESTPQPAGDSVENDGGYSAMLQEFKARKNKAVSG